MATAGTPPRLRFDDLEVGPLAAGDAKAVAGMLARSFEVDAGYRTLFPDAATRTEGLRGFFERNLGIHLPHRCTLVASHASSGPVATVTIRPPGGVPVSAWTLLRHGIVPMALEHGAAFLRRLLWLKSTYEGLEHELGAGRPYWHVHMMAVHEQQQGAGIGSRMLEHALLPCAARPAPIVLTTHLEENVVFYRRAGFEVVSQRQLHPPTGPSYAVWSMRRA